VPTFATTPRFRQDIKGRTAQQRQRFERVVREQFVPDLDTGRFRPGLRVTRVQATSGVFEMTWAPDGRATWQYGTTVRDRQPHVIWRRIGTHAIFNPGPP
jgi:hypothetical protein